MGIRWWSKALGYNDRSWLDHRGHPHTQALRITERYWRPDFGHQQIEMTLTIPPPTHPWTISLGARSRRYGIAGRSLQRGQWKAPATLHRQGLRRKKTEAKVAPETLAKYVGTFEEQDIWGQGPHPRIIEITVGDGKLYAELKGREGIELVAQSDTYFTGFFNWQVELIPRPHGVPAYLNEVHVSGNYRYRLVK